MYNLDAVKAKLDKITGADKKAKADARAEEQKSSFAWFKKEPGRYEIRFMPYVSATEQPFEEIFYYNNMADQRVLSRAQFGLEDPINVYVQSLDEQNKKLFKTDKEASKKVWKEMVNIKGKPRYYGFLLVRGQEDKGPQAIELAEETVAEIYNILTGKNYKGKNVMDMENGFDFELTIAPIPGKLFKNKPVMKMTFMPDMQPSKLGTKKQIEEWTSKMVKFDEHFKKFLKSEEDMNDILQNYMASRTATLNNEKQNPLGTEKGNTGDDAIEALKKQLQNEDDSDIPF